MGLPHQIFFFLFQSWYLRAHQKSVIKYADTGRLKKWKRYKTVEIMEHGHQRTPPLHLFQCSQKTSRSAPSIKHPPKYSCGWLFQGSLTTEHTFQYIVMKYQSFQHLTTHSVWLFYEMVHYQKSLLQTNITWRIWEVSFVLAVCISNANSVL